MKSRRLASCKVLPDCSKGQSPGKQSTNTKHAKSTRRILKMIHLASFLISLETVDFSTCNKTTQCFCLPFLFFYIFNAHGSLVPRKFPHASFPEVLRRKQFSQHDSKTQTHIRDRKEHRKKLQELAKLKVIQQRMFSTESYPWFG